MVPTPDKERGGEDGAGASAGAGGLCIPAAYTYVHDETTDLADQPTAVLAALPAAHDFTRERRARWHDQMADGWWRLYERGVAGAYVEVRRHEQAAAQLRAVRETNGPAGGGMRAGEPFMGR